MNDMNDWTGSYSKSDRMIIKFNQNLTLISSIVIPEYVLEYHLSSDIA